MKNLLKIFFTLLLLIIVISGFAQNESNIWYFGQNAGLDFNSPSPISLTGGLVNAHGGSSTMCDANGDLLLYSNGMSVWNKNHTLMPNGYGLLGHASSTQNSIIIPLPNSNDFYIFTNDAYTGTNGLCYSEIDMSAAGGLGDVTSIKNVSVLLQSTEKLTAVMHTNEVDYWIISHERGTNAFYAIPLTSVGVGVPVVSNVGIVHDGANSNSDISVGQMKASPDGTRLALATSAGGNTFEIFSFDPSSGVVSNPITLSSIDYANPYGVEFSADGTKLYCSTTNNNKLFQVNLQAGSASAIIASVTLVATSSSSNIGGLQIGADSKIYLARHLNYYLGVINNPNTIATNCDYVDDGVHLDTKRSRRGLPNFIQSYFNNPRFTYEHLCYGDSTYFYISDLNGVNSVLWNFDDPSSGVDNTSIINNPYHIFSNSGTYNVKLIRYFGTYSDTVVQPVLIHSLPTVDIGSSIISICENSDTLLDASGGFETYIWQNGSVSPSITVSTPGLYSVTVTDDFGCENSDEVEITILNAPIIDLGSDTIICEGDNVTLTANFEVSTFIWSTGQSVASIVVGNADVYSVTVSNNCGYFIDTIDIGIYPTISFDLGVDIDMCVGDTATLDPGDLGVSYLWSTGSTNQVIDVTQAGLYFLDAFYSGTSCSIATDTIMIVVLAPPSITISKDTLICEGDEAVFEAYGQLVTDYIWSTGAVHSEITVGVQGTYSVTASNVCGTAIDTVYLLVQPLPNIDVGDDVSLYSDESYQLEATNVSSWDYLWTPDYELSATDIYNPIATPQVTTIYNLEVTDTVGCSRSTSITIIVSDRPLPEIVIYNTFTPNGDGTNDYWVIENIKDYTNSTLEIYNRNGNKVFSTTNYQSDWDGTYKNKDLPAHTYFYILNTGEEEKGIFHGNVTIIR